MGQQEYLIDTNIAIAYLDHTLPDAGYNFVGNLPAVLSVITRIEMLGWINIQKDALTRIETYLNRSFIYPLDEPVILKTIELRQRYKMKTPDAIIAATAIVNNLTLLTRNIADFKQLPDFKVLDPFSI